jgi:hypothetical protein
LEIRPLKTQVEAFRKEKERGTGGIYTFFARIHQSLLDKLNFYTNPADSNP